MSDTAFRLIVEREIAAACAERDRQIAELRAEVAELKLRDASRCECVIGCITISPIQWERQCNYHRQQEAELQRERQANELGVEWLHAAEEEVKKLRAYIADQLCECCDEYGVEFPTPCERCVVLGLKAAKAAGEKHG